MAPIGGCFMFFRGLLVYFYLYLGEDVHFWAYISKTFKCVVA